MKCPRSLFFSLILIGAGAVNCAPGDSAGSTGRQHKLEQRELTIERENGETVKLLAEIARTDDQRARGLMGRSSLKDGEGMLFVFEKDQILSFWMKNTLLPLSIAYIAYDGRIMEIHDMKPQDTTAIQSRRSGRYALEVPQGWFTRAGISIGDRCGPVQ
ncbi:conserved hypothetical protein [Treponema primitia ZAS-2]|uniref:Lipoprotein n=1 Tax=Treponema primitia (strain ATCC BAA-887 / DSM 12427 / ZAS-2) TaxID=545694 RepID=F5YKD7_TREPZ|nr:DUF192 domain-containing protein [Treponema primitia]AEF85716.1 conserved hypothetical protein [Treponema primitia ZAS-2]